MLNILFCSKPHEICACNVDIIDLIIFDNIKIHNEIKLLFQLLIYLQQLTKYQRQLQGQQNPVHQQNVRYQLMHQC